MSRYASDGHETVIGLIELVWGALHFVGGLIALGVMALISLGVLGAGDAEFGERLLAGGIVTGIGVFVAFIAFLFGLPMVLAGWGLLNGRRWARILSVIIGILNLVHFPIGTAFGAYVLWVFLLRDKGL